MKKIISVLTIVCMLFSLVPTFVMAQEQSSDITQLLNETFDGYNSGVTVNGQGSWVVENSTAAGNETYISADPKGDNSSDKVLHVDLGTSNDSSKNKYAKLSMDKSIGNNKYVMFNEKVMFTTKVNSAVFYAYGKVSNGSASTNGYLIQVTYDVANKKILNITKAGNVTVAENVTFPTDSWIDFKFVFDTAKLTFDIYMNNVKMNTSAMNFYLYDGTTDYSVYKADRLTAIYGGSIRHARGDGSGNIYYDDMVITAFNDAGYAETDLLNTKVDLKDNGTFSVPSTGIMGSGISWTSDNNAITISGTTATVNKPYTSQDVTLTATAAYNGATATKTYSVKVNGYVESDVIYSEDFNTGYTDGNINGQNTWSVSANAKTGNENKISSDPVPDSVGDKAVKVELMSINKGADADNNKYATMALNKNISSYDYVVFSHKLYYADNDRYANFYITFNNTATGGNHIQFTYNPEDKTAANHFTSGSKEGTQTFGSDVDVPVGKWIDFKIVLNRNAKTYDFYMDNVRIGESLYIYDISEVPTSIKNIQIGVYRRHGKNGVIYYDDIAINGYKTADKTWSDLYNLTVPNKADGDFTLPSGLGNNAAITWTSSNSDVIAINGNNASVTLPFNSTDVILTATATSNGLSASREFVCRVLGYRDSIDTLYSEDFDDFDNADINGQSGWDLDRSTYTENGESKPTTGNNTTVAADVIAGYSGDKAMKVELVKAWTGDNRYARKAIDKDIPDKKYLKFSTDIMLENGAKKANFYIQFNSSDVNHIQITLSPADDENRFWNATSNGTVVFGGDTKIPYGKWLRLDLILDVNAKTYDLYMDNVKLNSTPLTPYNANDITTIKNLRFGAIRTHGGTGFLYYDDVEINAFGDSGAVWYAMNTLSMPSKVHDDFDISALFASSISWTDNSEAISVTGTKAVVNAPNNNQDATLTATCTMGKASYSEQFNLTVLAAKNAYTINNITVDGNKLTKINVTKNTDNNTLSSKAIVAIYDGNKDMIVVSQPTTVTTSGDINLDMDIPQVAEMSITAFVWDMTNLSPLAQSLTR